MKLFINLQEVIYKHLDRNAFFINETFYSYADLAKVITKIRISIRANTGASEKIIGLITNDDIETYAAIFAVWFEGKAYVPLSTDTPKERNESVIKQAGIITILDSSEKPFIPELKIIETKKLPETDIDLKSENIADDELAYMLFTSGTTGVPKGVPINRANLTGIIDALDAMKFDIDENDRCLQMSELTFDVSITSFLFPLLKGACVYTIPKGKIKYSYVYKLMDEQKLTVAQLVPSLLNYLRPYFDEMDFPEVKYSLLTAEALPLDLAIDWKRCVPNAVIINLYGPTENTVWSTYYVFEREKENKSYNGMLSIGKATEGTGTIIIDENNKLLPAGEKGELCLCGVQLTPGYWKNEEKNKEAFFNIEYNQQPTRFYKTGDLCSMDESGDILYMGRIDFQAKIQGFRVELSEIEFHCKAFLQKTNAVAVAIQNKNGNTEIGLAIESKEFDTGELINYMKTKMPAYMLPTQVIFEQEFPLNSNGKIDRNILKTKFQ